MPFPKILLLTFFSPLILLPVCVIAAPTATPRDLPPGHWAGSSVKRVVHENIMGTTPDGRFQGNAPVTRYELAVALDRFVQYVEAGRKPLHAQVFPVPAHLAPAASLVQRQALTRLISQGFLPVKSSLVTKRGSGLVTAKETSDALAAVTIRLSDRAEPPQKN
jgi:hypothetical protein